MTNSLDAQRLPQLRRWHRRVFAVKPRGVSRHRRGVCPKESAPEHHPWLGPRPRYPAPDLRWEQWDTMLVATVILIFPNGMIRTGIFHYDQNMVVILVAVLTIMMSFIVIMFVNLYILLLLYLLLKNARASKAVYLVWACLGCTKGGKLHDGNARNPKGNAVTQGFKKCTPTRSLWAFLCRAGFHQ